MSEVLIPRVLWAQRKDVVYVTFEVFEVKEEKIDIKDNVVTFTGVRGSDDAKFGVTLELFGSVDVANCKIAVGHRDVSLILAKSEVGPFWPRLLKSSQKMHYIHTDFSKWVDEDEEDEEEVQNADMSGMGGMGGMGNFGNFDMSQFAGMGGGEDEDEAFEEEEEEGVKISGLTKDNESFE